MALWIYKISGGMRSLSVLISSSDLKAPPIFFQLKSIFISFIILFAVCYVRAIKMSLTHYKEATHPASLSGSRPYASLVDGQEKKCTNRYEIAYRLKPRFRCGSFAFSDNACCPGAPACSSKSFAFDKCACPRVPTHVQASDCCGSCESLLLAAIHSLCTRQYG